MICFVELTHLNGTRSLVNVDKIQMVQSSDHGQSKIWFGPDDYTPVKESYDFVVKELAAAVANIVNIEAEAYRS